VTDEVASPPELTAGAQLRAAREAAGLSVDAVAQQLKLAPRQVRALEDDEFDKLPGRTFVRGFIRNYARCLHLDAEALVALLPASTEVAHGPLDRPTLGPGPRRMGELPADAPRTPTAARWLAPLVLIVIIAAAAYYEWSRPQSETRRIFGRDHAPPRNEASSTPPPQPAATLPSAATSTPLSNPVEDTGSRGPRVLQDAPASAVTPAPVAPAATDAPSEAAPSSGSAESVPAPLLSFEFRAASWIEVKDANGKVIVSATGTPGTKQSVSGAPPFDVVVGKSDAVAVTFRGQPVDLASHQRQNVARLTLQ